MKSIAIVCLLLLLGACATHDVHCEGQLRPIGNAAARTAGNGSEVLLR